MSAPGIPNNFEVQTSNQQILVSWDLSAGATSYIIQRSLDNIAFSPLVTVSGSPLATSYLDTAVTLGNQYWYKVAASNTIGFINFTGQPNPGNTASIDNVVFTAVSSAPTGTQFLIGTSVTQTIANFAQVVNVTIPGIVAVDSSSTQLILSAYSTAIVQLSSSLTNTTVTPFTTGSTSPYTSSASAIPTPTGEMSLQGLKLAAQQRADRVNSQFVTQNELRGYVNQAMFELYDLLITLYEDLYVATPIQFTANGNQYLFPLPDGSNTFLNGITLQSFTPKPFYKLLGVDLAIQNVTNGYVTVNKFNFIDRNRYVYPNTSSTIYGVFNMQYRLMGLNQIEFIPTPSGNQSIRVWYVPRLKELLMETDITDIGISGWLEYVIVRAAKYILDKEESDTTKLDQELLFLKARIEETASNRDAGLPDTISASRQSGGTGWGDGGGNGGFNGSTGGF